MKRLALALAAIGSLAGCGGGGGPPGSCPFALADCRSAAGNTPQPAPGPAVFKFEGVGANVFTTPDRVARYQVLARTTENAKLFRFEVNAPGGPSASAAIGTGFTPPDFSGIYLIPARAIVEVRADNGVAWSFTELP